MELLRIYVSDGHAYVGRHGQPSAPYAMRAVDRIECVAGCGLRGDRFFGYKPDYKGQVTLFSAAVFAALRGAFPGRELDPAALRRNLLVAGQDLNALIGQEFELQGVRLLGVEECRPCYWMDQAIGPGAEDWLRGRGGLRCRVLGSGWLETSPLVAGAAA